MNLNSYKSNNCAICFCANVVQIAQKQIAQCIKGLKISTSKSGMKFAVNIKYKTKKRRGQVPYQV